MSSSSEGDGVRLAAGDVLGARSLAMVALSIRNFRNLASVELELGARFNVFAGDNGQGKTNLLEAIYVLSTSRSFRTARLSELVGRGAETASLRGGIVEAGAPREQTIGIRHGLRAARIDGKRPPTLAAYAVSTPTVEFHPGSAVLAAGGGAERRKLLDRVSLYLAPAVIEHADSYARALRARQRVLNLRGPGATDLSAWEELMVRHGHALGQMRDAASSLLVPKAQLAFSRLGSPLPLHARYRPAFPSDVERFRVELEQSRVRDRARGAASLGPHRDELWLEIGDQPVRGMASQGQQRAVVLALKMAEIQVIAEVRGVLPLLLLDDVSSELDRKRTASLVATLLAAKGQVLVTTTRPEWVEEAGLSVSSGRRDFVVVGGSVSVVR